MTEAAALVPLCRGCEQLVLVGDQCQLPPTVASQRAVEVGFAVPLFNRLVSLGVEPLLLDTQYRMHPAISQFPSDLFYGTRHEQPRRERAARAAAARLEESGRRRLRRRA